MCYMCGINLAGPAATGSVGFPRLRDRPKVMQPGMNRVRHLPGTIRMVGVIVIALAAVVVVLGAFPAARAQLQGSGGLTASDIFGPDITTSRSGDGTVTDPAGDGQQYYGRGDPTLGDVLSVTIERWEFGPDLTYEMRAERLDQLCHNTAS